MINLVITLDLVLTEAYHNYNVLAKYSELTTTPNYICLERVHPVYLHTYLFFPKVRFMQQLIFLEAAFAFEIQ